MALEARALKNFATAALLALLAIMPAGAQTTTARREVALTFDDVPGIQVERGGCSYAALKRLNTRLLGELTTQRVPAAGLVVERNLCADEEGDLADLLELWLDAGMELGNHTYSHPDLNNVSVAAYTSDIVRGEATTRALLQSKGQRLRYFRHPYLHTGRDLKTRRAIEKFLMQRGYQVAPVTIDNQEWIFAAVYARAAQKGDRPAMQRIGTAYVSYMEEMFDYYEKLSVDVLGYEVRQILLLHDNPLNADYLGSLLAMMRRRGYEFVTLERALADPAYRSADTYVGAEGLSWLHRWAVSKGMPKRAEPREPPWIQDLFRSTRR